MADADAIAAHGAHALTEDTQTDGEEEARAPPPRSDHRPASNTCWQVVQHGWGPAGTP